MATDHHHASPFLRWMLLGAMIAAAASVALFFFAGDTTPQTTPPPAASVAPPAAKPAPPSEPALAAADAARPVSPAPPAPTPATSPAATAPAPAPTKEQAAQPAATFLDELLAGGGDTVCFALPGGETLRGRAEQVERGDSGVSTVQGRLTGARPGTFSFERIVLPDGSVALRGMVMFENSTSLYRLESRGGQPVFVEQDTRR